MGRRNKACHKDLHQQAYESLTSIQAGEPACSGADAGRHQAARNAPGCPFIPGGLTLPMSVTERVVGSAYAWASGYISGGPLGL